MESVVVTLTSPYLKEKHPRDLLLPLDTPQYIIVNTLVDALNIDIDENILRGFLSTHKKGNEETFSLEKTLRDVGVKYGDFLILDFQEIVARASLICIDGPEFDLDRNVTIIGCHPDADIDLRSVPKQELVSGIHAKIIQRNEDYYLIDMQSTNGTYISQRTISSGEEILLEKDSIIHLGAPDEQSIRVYIKRRFN